MDRAEAEQLVVGRSPRYHRTASDARCPDAAPGATFDARRRRRHTACMDVTQRFSNRVAEYVKFRPSYPEAVFGALATRLPPNLPRVAADIGSGTGIFSRGLLAHGFEVHAVEPNPEMRQRAEQSLAAEPRFHSGGGRAEATELPDQSVALVVAAQAFHWFDVALSRREWRRILRPGGCVGLVWNQRQLGSPFMAAYEAVMSSLEEYPRISCWQRDESAVVELFGPQGFATLEFPNQQIFDWAGLRGRVLSSSYVPRAGQPGHDPLMTELERCFNEHSRSGSVQFDYVTRLHFGPLDRREIKAIEAGQGFDEAT